MRTRVLLQWTMTPLLVIASGASGTSASLCVTSNGSSGCYAHISDAITSANAGDTVRIGPGTYVEALTVTKSLNLQGDRAVLDGSSLNAAGIVVDGLASPGLTAVSISGMTIQNFSFEGILVVNASAVTINANTVTDNNRALSAGTCPGLPAFETLEQSDCGEGIHFLGVDHSVISNNIVTGNAGGVLLADDTGATHDNLISYNTVRENGYACGITLASHPAAPLTGSPMSLGVYHNTVYGNRASRNGLLNGGGSGVGLFTSVPGAKTYSNVVANNLVTENGLPGIAMHAHVPGQNLSDNMIVGNTVISNGPDSADAATPGPTGINVYGAGLVTGTIISGNAISGEAVDIAVKTPALVQVHLNAFYGLQTGLLNLGTGMVDATVNWWGCDRGPSAAGCSSTGGAGVTASAWMVNSIPQQPVF